MINDIIEYNKNRNKNLLKIKYKLLCESPFRFFRGTNHLFYNDIPPDSFLLDKNSPTTIQCGDLHLENFGTFKAENRLIYFDMNDFDESFVGPILLDITRLSTSVFLAKDIIGIDYKEANKLIKILLKSYKLYLSNGLIRSIEKDSSRGSIKLLMSELSKRKRKKFIDNRIIKNKIKLTDKIFKCGLKIKNKLKQKFKNDFDILDVSIRVAGTGSIGVERYMMLIKRNHKKYLIDMKESSPSSFTGKFIFKNNSDKLITLQKYTQSNSPDFLKEVFFNGKWFTIKELQPTNDKLNLCNIPKNKLVSLMEDIGSIVAFNNHRSSGKMGTSSSDELMNFGKQLDINNIIGYSQNYYKKVLVYHKEWVKNYTEKI